MFLREQVLNSYLKQAGGAKLVGALQNVSTYAYKCPCVTCSWTGVHLIQPWVVFENKGIFIAIDHWPLRFSLGFLHLQFDFSQTHNNNGTQLSDIDDKCKVLRRSFVTLNFIREHT